MSKLIENMKENNIFLLIIGFIFSVFSIGRFNMVISIYIWPYCFLSFLHRKESKLCPLIIVSLLIICSNMLRWIGISHLNLGFDFFMGIYYSIINIIPFIIDDIFYNKI